MATKSEAPSLSVVIPTHNTRALTLRCLASVERAAPEAEVVVVDDASADGTAEAIAAHPRARLLRLPEPAGFTRAANRGMAAAGGEVLLLLNSDTEVEPGGPAALCQAFAANRRLGAAGAVLHYPDGSPQWSGGREPTLPWLFALASGTPGLLAHLPYYRRLKPPGARPTGRAVEWVTGAAMALRREAWQEAGPFDEGFRFYGQDLDLCAALRSKGWGVALLPAFRVLHHHGATIGRLAGAAMGRQDTELLWSDLLRWAAKRRGAAWARRAGAALAAGGGLRLAARVVALPFLPAAGRAVRRQEDRSLRRAIAAARQPH